MAPRSILDDPLPSFYYTFCPLESPASITPSPPANLCPRPPHAAYSTAGGRAWGWRAVCILDSPKAHHAYGHPHRQANARASESKQPGSIYTRPRDATHRPPRGARACCSDRRDCCRGWAGGRLCGADERPPLRRATMRAAARGGCCARPRAERRAGGRRPRRRRARPAGAAAAEGGGVGAGAWNPPQRGVRGGKQRACTKQRAVPAGGPTRTPHPPRDSCPVCRSCCSSTHKSASSTRA